MSTQSIYEQRQSFLLTPNSTLRGGLIFCILVGVVSFFAGMFVADAPTRTWGSFLFNLFFFFAIALGGSIFAGMQDVISARWGRPIMRLHEAFISFLPVSLVALAVFFVCIWLKVGHADEVFSWIKNPSSIAEDVGKRDWLKPGIFMVRDLAAVLVIMLLARWQLMLKVNRDQALMQGDQAKAAQLAFSAQQKLRYWSAPIMVVYALLFSMLSFDLMMSLAPKWYSTLWGGWAFAAMMQSFLAALLFFMYVVKRSPVGQHIRRQQFHDVGKLMHGFTAFFGYITYAHIITYWYGNIPEETEYFLHRLKGPWLGIMIAAAFLVFVFPLYSLLPKASKWTAGMSLPICFAILFAQWLVSLLVVIPQTVADNQWSLPWIEVGIFLGFLGLFLSSITWFGRRYPMLAIADPLLAEALHEGH